MKYIKSFQVENFKVFRKTTFNFNPQLNVLTGINNSGKTTLLEALALWQTCFYKVLNQIKGKAFYSKEAGKVIANPGDYVLGYSKRRFSEHGGIETVINKTYVSTEEMPILRSVSPSDIHHFSDSKNIIRLEATIADSTTNVLLPPIAFTIKAMQGGQYSIQFPDADRYDFTTLNDFFQKLPNPITFVYSSPVAYIKAHEDFHTLPQMRHRVKNSQSALVMRNRIAHLKRRENDFNAFSAFQSSLSKTLTDSEDQVTLKIEGDIDIDPRLQVTMKTNPRSHETEIALVGSGTLQIMEILLAVNEDKTDLNVILLDEPDSHIHRDIQKRLLSVLKSYENTQVFVTTHNESLIRTTLPEQIFHLEGTDREVYEPIATNQTEFKKMGWQPSAQTKILSQLGYSTALDFLNAVEADCVLLVEGTTDAQYVDKILNSWRRNKKYHIAYWTTNGVDQMFNDLSAYQKIFGLIKNEQTLWKKTLILTDKDTLTEEQREKLMTALKEEKKVNAYIWNCRCIESTIFTNNEKLKKILHLYLKKKTTISITEDEFDDIFNEVLNKTTTELKKQITDKSVASENSLGSDIEKLQKSIEDAGVKRVFLGEKSTHSHQLKAELNRSLNGANLSLWICKKTAKGFVENLITKLNLSITLSENYFNELLDIAIEYRILFDEWENLKQKVDLIVAK
jgi:predicted ATP-dependent endonuclease of OLD family